MLRIGLLSDTHGYWDDRYLRHLGDCDEVWHAGDIGSMELMRRFRYEFREFRAVCGNVDGADLRLLFPGLLRWRCEQADVMMTHIGGYPGHYAPSVRPLLQENPPALFISGHSHILKVQYDKTLHLLHINPGAAGLQGWQQVRTLVRFTIDKKDISDLDVIELTRT